MTSPAPVRFGQVWESPDEAIGSMRYLIVSSDAYNAAFGDRRAIAVEIARSHLVQLIGHLHPDRHTHVTEVIRTLIGNL